jgi:hypothetical protein
MQQQRIRFKPILWRFALFRVIVVLTVSAVIVASYRAMQSAFDWIEWASYILAAGFAFVLLSIPVYVHHTILVTDQSIEGPAVSHRWRRVAIPLSQVERVQLPTRQKIRKQIGEYQIASSDGKKIYIDGWTFGQEQVIRLFELIDLRQSSENVC